MFATIILNDVRGQVLRCTGTYYFYVELQSFNNPGNEDYDGGCCDVGCGSCDNYFILCLRQPGYDVHDNFCPYGSFSTSSDPDSGSALTFTTGPNALAPHVPNPLEYAGNTWPVSVNRWLGLVYVFSKLYSFTERRFAVNLQKIALLCIQLYTLILTGRISVEDTRTGC